MNLSTWTPVQPRTGREGGGDGGGKFARKGEAEGPAGEGEVIQNFPYPLLSDLLHGGLTMSAQLRGSEELSSPLLNSVGICCTIIR